MISVLITSLDADYLSELLPQVRNNGTREELEIVVCSPYKPPDGVLWVPDTNPTGNNWGVRQCYKASHGDPVVMLPDDIKMRPDWLRQGLSVLDEGSTVVCLRYDVDGYIFDRLYSNFPLARRQTVDTHWEHFFPYQQHWGDPAFSLSVWLSGGKVVPTPGRPMQFRARKDHPESAHKASTFKPDLERFLDDFSGPAKEWMLNHWRSFNEGRK